MKVTTTTTEGVDPVQFHVLVRFDGAVEVQYYRNGGSLQTVLHQMMKSGNQ